VKIDKSRGRHWWWLVLMGASALFAICLRPFFSRRPSKASPITVVLYGHKLNGNLLAIYREMRDGREHEHFDVFYLTMDRDYFTLLSKAGERCVLASPLQCVSLLVKTDAIITGHGLHALGPLVSFSSIQFFDVWHGIPFKGFDADDFRVQHRYRQIWVASPCHKQLYVDRYGFDESKVITTGYARTDRLVLAVEDPSTLRARFGVPAQGKLVLFAPTWAQDAAGRSLYPFNCSEAAFLGALSELANRLGVTILMRAHLNSGTGVGAGYAHVVPLPHDSFPDTEGILLISDILICDWSSIAFDYLLLNRPTVFLDVEAPFRKGFSLGPEYRFGAVVDSLPGLIEELAGTLADAGQYWQRYANKHQQTRDRVYAEYADGHATRRCVAELQRAVEGY